MSGSKPKNKGLAEMDTVVDVGSDVGSDFSISSNSGNKVSSNKSTNENMSDSSKPNVDSNNDVDTFDGIITKINSKVKPIPKRQIAFYLDEDIARAFDKYARRNGKGAKSELIGELLRPALRKMNYLD